MICKKCGNENNEQNKFCSFCGAKLEEDDKLRCPKCGSENNPGDKFCWLCGTNLEETASEPVEEVRSSKPRRCKICGTLNPADKNFCALCGSQLSDLTEEELYVSKVKAVPQVEDGTLEKLGIKTLVFGIIAIIASVTFMLFPLGFAMGIVATILGIVYLAKKGTKYRSKAVVGLVLGLIAIVLSVLLALLIYYLATSPEVEEYFNELLSEYQPDEFFRWL